MAQSKKFSPVFAEDSNVIDLAPILAETVEELGNSDDKFDFIMAFFITLMAESGYRVSCLYDENNDMWNHKMTCIPKNWKPPGKNIYEIDFLLYKRKAVGCKLIGIPVGDWIILNLLAKGASNRCKTRSITINVPKHVNVYKKELNPFWHLKELALNFKNNLLAPLHGELMMEIGVASPSLQGLPEEIKVYICKLLDEQSRTNLKETCKEFSDELQNSV